MGLNACGDEFCQRTGEAMEGLQGVKKLVDDILIYAPNDEILFTESYLSSRDTKSGESPYLKASFNMVILLNSQASLLMKTDQNQTLKKLPQ